jgi:hypothetical protein
VGCHISSLVLGLEEGAGFRSKRTKEKWSVGALMRELWSMQRDARSKVAGLVYHGNSTIARGNGTA